MEGEEEEKERQVSHTRHDRLSINSEATLNLDSAHAGASELEPDVCLLFFYLVTSPPTAANNPQEVV
jgi:hypothetical protein